MNRVPTARAERLRRAQATIAQHNQARARDDRNPAECDDNGIRHRAALSANTVTRAQQANLSTVRPLSRLEQIASAGHIEIVGAAIARARP